MATINGLSDQQLQLCIYQNCCTVQELRSMLNQPGIVTDNRINQDAFARVFSDWYQGRQDPDNVSWVIPYFIADEIHKLL